MEDESNTFPNLLAINLWIKDHGDYMSHKEGLTAEQIADLQKLKEGDRLILWKNNKRRTDKDASATLRKYNPKKKNDLGEAW